METMSQIFHSFAITNFIIWCDSQLEDKNIPLQSWLQTLDRIDVDYATKAEVSIPSTYLEATASLFKLSEFVSEDEEYKFEQIFEEATGWHPRNEWDEIHNLDEIDELYQIAKLNERFRTTDEYINSLNI
jgi:hypothetical protein